MNALMKRLLLSCLFILMIMLSVSCTLGGLGLGAGLDSINNPSVIEGREVTSLDKGEPIKILKYDQSMIEGRYQGVKIIPKANFERFYREQKALSNANLPGMGDSILVLNKADKQIWYKFIGLNPDNIFIERFNSDRPGLIKFDFIREIHDTAHNEIMVNSLKSLANKNDLFFKKKIILHVDNEEKLIDPADIKDITIYRSDTYYALILGAVGLAIDITLIMYIINQPPPKYTSKSDKDWL